MTLRHRLYLFGAGLPTVLIVMALIATSSLLDLLLLRSMDQALMTQAAVESVSLFDADERAHLHIDESPMLSRVSRFAAAGAIYDARGRLIARSPPSGVFPKRYARAAQADEPVMETVRVGGVELRRLTVALRDGDGQRFGLVLQVSLAEHDTVVRLFRYLAAGIAACVALALLGVQLRHARSLERRIRALADYMSAVRDGDSEITAPVDPRRDIIGRLRDGIAEATERLASAARGQRRLVANAGHELRTPLASMQLSLDLALRRERTPDELRAVLHETREEVRRLTELATRLLDFSTIEGVPLTRERGDLRQIIDEAFDARAASAEQRGVLFEFEGPDPVPAVFAPGPMRQVFDNLLSNAVRFSPEGGVIRVEVTINRRHIEVRVADQGPGVAPDQRERIFEPFHRLARGVPGAGLGLAISRDIMRRHGGTVSLDARLEVGACFVLRLPVGGGRGGSRG